MAFNNRFFSSNTPEEDGVRKQVKGDKKVDRALTFFMKLGEKPKTLAVWVLQHDTLPQWVNVRGFCKVFHSEPGLSSCSIIRPKLHYQKEYVDMVRVFDRKLVFQVWNVSDFLDAWGGSKLQPIS